MKMRTTPIFPNMVFQQKRLRLKEYCWSNCIGREHKRCTDILLTSQKIVFITKVIFLYDAVWPMHSAWLTLQLIVLRQELVLIFILNQVSQITRLLIHLLIRLATCHIFGCSHYTAQLKIVSCHQLFSFLLMDAGIACHPAVA